MLSKSHIKLIRSLSTKKYRKLNNLFIVEGERLVSEAIQSNVVIKELFLTNNFLAQPQHNELIEEITEKSVVSNIVDEKEMKIISDTISPSGILALCEIPTFSDFNINNTENWLYLDEIQNPGNLGTLLRSAAWFGVRNVALSENCIDIYNPKVLRGGMGAHFSLSIHENIALNDFKNTQHNIIGAFQDGKNILEIDKTSLKPWVLIIGNEAHGINRTNFDKITYKVTIHKVGSGESLNAAVAGSILLSQLTQK